MIILQLWLLVSSMEYQSHFLNSHVSWYIKIRGYEAKRSSFAVLLEKGGFWNIWQYCYLKSNSQFTKWSTQLEDNFLFFLTCNDSAPFCVPPKVSTLKRLCPCLPKK
ncbi:Putative germin-like protein 2-2 [Olea europaea subsp. europaea]|uniref:Germin-like protein 2-2 n=1 Tax=Olea europaea subsp. europaea TaxID=158383 RepID=A0A8S0RY78_OLEEU|nr:Putative germin-like protein 2-2 [Olea europaea subsp. europaea]